VYKAISFFEELTR